MSGLLSSIFDSGAGGLAAKVAAYAEARQTVLAENIANIDTPGYKTRDLPLGEFQEMLAEALEEGERTGGPIRLRSTRSIEVNRDGTMTFKAAERTGQGFVFHDQGNRDIETEMSEMVKTSVMHRVAIEVMKKQGEMLRVAIRERV